MKSLINQMVLRLKETVMAHYPDASPPSKVMQMMANLENIVAIAEGYGNKTQEFEIKKFLKDFNGDDDAYYYEFKAIWGFYQSYKKAIKFLGIEG